eukprot:4695690-Amphidinium_carterae.1
MQSTQVKDCMRGKHMGSSTLKAQSTHSLSGADLISSSMRAKDRSVAAGEPSGSKKPMGSCTPRSLSKALKGEAV